MSKTSKELRQKRAGLFEQAKAILADKETLTAEEQSQYDGLMSEIDDLKAQVDRIERSEQMEAEMAADMDRRADINGTSPGEETDKAKAEQEAFTAYLKNGISNLNPEHREIMQAKFKRDPQGAQGVGSGSTGGYLVPEGFYATMTEALLDYNAVRQACTILPTATGNDLPMPTVNDTSNKGALLGENTDTSENALTFGQKTLKAYKYTSKIVLVSLELLQDSAFDINAFLSRKLGERIGRITADHMTTGTGSGQPNGIVTAAALGKTGASGQTSTIIYDDLVDLMHSVDPAYRTMPGCGWMMPDTMLKTLRKLKDGESRPIWQPGVAAGEPDNILGKPYYINQSMADPEAEAKTLLFGDLKSYFVRDVMDVMVLRLVERYAEYGQVGFLAFSRHDGELLDAGTNPVKYYAHPAA
jgi:HK97 family phage major capsid protein